MVGPWAPPQHHGVERTAFYKVPFTEALELVARRHVHLEDGLAYVPAPKLVVIIAGHFRAQLSASLRLASARPRPRSPRSFNYSRSSFFAL